MVNKTLVNKLTELLRADGVSALMVAPGADMKFLLGSAPMLCERFQALVVKDDGGIFYICNNLYYDEVTDIVGPDVPVYGWHDSEDFTLVVKRAFSEQGLIGKKVAVNGTVRAFNLVRILKNVDITPENGKHYLEMTRIIKTPEEMDNLRKASAVADKIYEGLLKFIKPGLSEKDVRNEIVRLSKENGGEFCYGGIVAVNEHAAMPHYMGDSGVIGEHAVIVMDYGCTVGGMNSDTTRTVVVGKATEREKYLYNLVLEMNLAGEAAAVNGAYAPDVDAAARKIAEDAGLGKYFNHRLGHGIGYAEHEEPYIHGDNHIYLAPGMCFSCEPGLYIKGEIGIRIEDLVLINEKGETEVLNKSTKELIEL